MSLSLKHRLLIGLYIFIVVSIPIGAYLASQAQTLKSSANSKTPTAKPGSSSAPTTTLTPAQSLLKQIEDNLAGNSPAPSNTPSSDTSTTAATSFGPTLSLKATIEGRASGSFATKLFIGIVEGTISENPKFLLSFTVDLPASGEYSNLSLAGLTPGTGYTALLKGAGQIATASSFTMSPTVTNLNDGVALNMKSGDLNEDNQVNSADLTILQSALGSTSTSANWNSNADFNGDGIINSFDLSILSNNIGQIGASGVWVSPIPQNATASASLRTSDIGGPASPAGGQGGPKDASGSAGYWLWIPK